MSATLTDQPAVDSLFHRPHEVLVRVTRWEPRQRCQHGKQIVEVQAHWSDDAPFTVTTGHQNSTQRYPRTLHADGTESDDFEYGVHHWCPKCGGQDTLTTSQEAWLDRTTCTVCGYESVFMIGD